MYRKLLISAAFLSLLAVVACRSAQHVTEKSSLRSVDSFAVHFVDSFVQRTILDSVFLSIVDTTRTVQFVRVSRALTQAESSRRDTTTIQHRDSTYVFTQTQPADHPPSVLRKIFFGIIIFFIGYILRDVQSRVWN